MQKNGLSWGGSFKGLMAGEDKSGQPAWVGYQKVNLPKCRNRPVGRRARTQKKRNFQKSYKKSVQEAQLVLVERLTSPYKPLDRKRPSSSG